MPNTACMPPGWTRKPVTISSNTSAAPLSSVMARSFFRKSSGRSAGWRLCTGSTMTAAMSSPLASIHSRACGSP